VQRDRLRRCMVIVSDEEDAVLHRRER